MNRLLKAGLIYAPHRGVVDFTIPLCADYIRRTDSESPGASTGEAQISGIS